MKERFGRPGNGEGVDTIGAFITFETTASAHAMLVKDVNKTEAAQALAKPGGKIILSKAPPPRDLKFENLEVPLRDRHRRKAFFGLMTAVIMICSLTVILSLK